MADKYLDFTTLKNYKLPNGGGLIGYDITTIQEVLEYYCLQVSPESNKDKKFKVSTANGLVKLYNIIASINGLDDRKSKINKRIYDEAIIYLPINDYKLIYAEAQFIIDEENRLDKVAKDQVAADKAAAQLVTEDIARREAERVGNEQWISANKQNYIDVFEKKIKEYENVINDLVKTRNNLIDKIEKHKKLSKKSSKDSEYAIGDLNNKSDPEIKKIRDNIRENREQHLSKLIIDDFNERLTKIKEINFEDYENYKTLKELIKKAKNSDKATDFVGKDGFKIKLPKILGGKTKKITTNKNGFIKNFKNIEDRKLGSGSDDDLDVMSELNDNVEDQIILIKTSIIDLVDRLKNLDNNLSEENKKNNTLYNFIIYFVVFLVVIGIGAYIFVQRREMSRIKKESEEKVGSLKSDFENKLKDTSEQIKSVSRTAAAARSQQIDTSSAPEPVEEIPKTAEEIVAEKYNELLSDYKEALDDFTKVAVFKQKWHGLPLSRKERQDGSKTILVSSTRAFEKAGIWCVTVGDKYYAFPGSTVKSNMATYMNMDFMKAGQDFKGVFAISTGSTYLTEPAMLRRGGVGFVVEGAGKIAFPD